MLTLLATDLDGTLVGDASALADLNSQLDKLMNAKCLKLVYATGRSPELFEQLCSEKELLQPHALITAVGTEIYVDGQRLAHWPHISSWDQTGITNLLAKFPELEKQPESEQREYKLSYFYEGDLSLIHRIQQELGPGYSVVYSGNRYLDILPADINKGSAVEWLCSYWQVPTTSVIACGDSENDVEMIARFKAIVVGNATDGLLKWCGKNQNPRIYLARGGYANGITEGLKHFRILE